MADWCRMDADLPEHPKTLHLMTLLELDLKGTVGTLGLLWLFTTKYAKDGVITPDKARGIARRMDLQMPDTDVLRHLQTVGLVEQGLDGAFMVHGFMERNGYQLRELERKREVARSRRATPARRSAPTRRDGTVRDGRDVDVQNSQTQPEGRKAVLSQAPAPSTPRGAEQPDRPAVGGDFASRFTPRTVRLVAEAYPRRDTTKLMARIVAKYCNAAVEECDRRLWNYAESAEKRDSERLDPEAFDQDAELERGRQLVAKRDAEREASRAGKDGPK